MREIRPGTREGALDAARAGRHHGAMARPSPRQRIGLGLVVAFFLVGAGGNGLDHHLRAAALLLRFQAPGETPTGLAAYGAVPVAVDDFAIATSAAPIRGRIYRPTGVDHAPGMVLVHGVHRDGIDEPRLGELATVLASSGIAVLTPEVRSLTRYRIGEEAVAEIGAAASSLAAELGRPRVGVMGISFAGGLSLLAGADPAHGGAIAFVVTVGAHHDLRRVARWYAGATAAGPGGEPADASPHPYGAGVLIHAAAEEFFTPEGLPLARELLELVLAGRGEDARARLFELRAADRAKLEQILAFCSGRPVAAADTDPLRAQYLAVLARHDRELAVASPTGRLARYPKPVFLLHGLGDPIVPATETLWLARELPSSRVEGRLLTPFLRHAERAVAPSPRDQLALVQLMAGVIAAAESE